MSNNWNLINKQTEQQDPEIRQAQRESRGTQDTSSLYCFRVVYIDSVHRQNLSGQNLSGLKPIGTKPSDIIYQPTEPIETKSIGGHILAPGETYQWT
jgi:hypothetical protein